LETGFISTQQKEIIDSEKVRMKASSAIAKLL
jgi:hypothetical protein